jgi:hypothetical protein
MSADATRAGWRERLAGLWPDRRTAVYWAMVINAEFLILAGYYTLATDVTLRDPLFAVIPFVWINLAGWAVMHTEVPTAPSRKKATAAAVAVGYFGLLAVFGGIVNGPSGVTSSYLNVLQLPPGWNPAFFYSGSLFSLVVLPYKLVGFAALSYLVYVTALDAASALAGGVLGLFSCVSCTFPVLAGLVSGLAGGGSAIAGFTYANSYLLSTVVFGVTVVLLTWRPSLVRGDG